MSQTTTGRSRVGVVLGTVGPCLFLLIAFTMAFLRRDVIQAAGWASWPSSMAIGGWSGTPQILAFLTLACCYPVFAWWSLRPIVGHGAAVAFTAIALGELFLACPTDARDQAVSWHGVMHLIGVFIVTIATAVAAAHITVATRHRPEWRPWRYVGAPSVAIGVAVGAFAGFHTGWAKVFFVLAITLPIPLLARLVAQDDRDRIG